MKIIERKDQLEARLLEFEKEIFEEWRMMIATKIPECMKKTLLRRSTDKLLILNFDETVRLFGPVLTISLIYY